MKRTSPTVAIWAGLLLLGCAGNFAEAPGLTCCDSSVIFRVKSLSPELKARILALDPVRVTEREVIEILVNAPAPRIINIHGGILPIDAGMNSFAQFLLGMGYPEAAVRNPGNGSYSFGYYDSSRKIAGTAAWYYEQDGLRPLIIGHSQGGIQVIRVLHTLAGGYGNNVHVWNALTNTEEARSEIRDPLTDAMRPIVGLQLPYASAAAAGGLARALPNVWNMNTTLRSIPDSVEEFTGFKKGLDPFGGDFLGYGSANDYRATGRARVRNVRLPASGSHWTIPYVRPLLKDQSVREWIENYQPAAGEQGLEPNWALRKRAQILWSAEVFYSIKEHWVIELQRLIRAQQRPS